MAIGQMDDYFDLGTYSRPVATRSAPAQRWFDRGLLWCYGFNHEEAVRCFKLAAEADPDCAMAYWGIAHASGPFYNKPWEWFGEDERIEAVALCHRTARRARSLAQSPVECQLGDALMARYQSDRVVGEDEFRAWEAAYANRMRAAVEAFPEDLDVIALSAEALVNRTPWKLWDIAAGEPAAGADTLEALALLETGLDLCRDRGLEPHPGLLHFYIHVLEMSPEPERARTAADQLRFCSPQNGHLLHMPSHIDVQCGRYGAAIAANDRAIEADRDYLTRRGTGEFYLISCCHDFHLKLYAAMMSGRYRAAMTAALGLRAMLSDDVLATDQPYMAQALEGYYAAKSHVMVRFGRWREIIDEPLPADPALHVLTDVMLRYAKGVAHAALGQIDAAAQARDEYRAAVAGIDDSHILGNNTARDVLAVATAMLDGELEYRKANYDTAFDHLRTAVGLCDTLAYAEPWDWKHPPRHALGALLIEQGRIDEATEVFRADLGLNATLPRCLRNHDNVWSLHGYVECLKRLRRAEEAAIMRQRLDSALANADVAIGAACFCSGAKKPEE